jgi:ElaB/YqjD/DUF883 family membrane-anchored ribosome-binding protein
MYGNLKERGFINPKVTPESNNADAKERLNAICDLKKNIDDHKKKTQDTICGINDRVDFTEQSMSDVHSSITKLRQDVEGALAEMNIRFDDVDTKIQQSVNDIYDSIENYVANQTPRQSVVTAIPDLSDVKQRLNDFETKLDILEKMSVATVPVTPPVAKKLIRPSTK